jgi:hypothetical protein
VCETGECVRVREQFKLTCAVMCGLRVVPCTRLQGWEKGFDWRDKINV